MICVECGKETKSVIDGSCAACFVAKNRLLEAPDVLEVEVCVHCGARRTGAHWRDEESAPEWIREDAVREALRVHQDVAVDEVVIAEHQQDEKTFRQHVRVSGRLSGTPVEDERELLLRQRRSVCDRCSRIQGGYYAAIIQLRATGRDVAPPELDRAHVLVSEELDRAQASGNRFAFLAKGGPMHGGHDYYIGDIEAGRGVARVLRDRLGAGVQESAKLVGRREGEDVYRVTFLVRIHEFAPGDFATSGTDVVQVQALTRGHAQCILLQDHRKTRLPAASLRRLGGPELIEEAVVVSEDESGIQILDPLTLQTVTLLRPVAWTAGEETVPVVRHDDALYIAPP